jgi:hypothetical protein
MPGQTTLASAIATGGVGTALNPYVPFDITRNILSAYEVLQLMYNSIAEGDPLKAFLRDKASDLLEPLPKFTPFPTKILENLYNNGDATPLSALTEYSVWQNYRGLSGVYWYSRDLSDYYLGSTVNLSRRFENHNSFFNGSQIGKSKLYKAITPYTKVSYSWSPVHTAESLIYQYYNLYRFAKALDTNYLILQSFEKYRVRSWEQALLSYFRPTLNDLRFKLTFEFLSWKPGLDPARFLSIGISVVAEDLNTGDKYPFDTVKHCKEALSIGSAETITRHINTGIPFTSPEGTFIFTSVDLPQQEWTPKSNLISYGPLQGIDIECLEPGKIFAFAEDKVTVLKEISNKMEALQSAFPETTVHTIRHYINVERPLTVMIAGLATKVYLARNPQSPKWYSKPTTAENVLTGEKYELPTRRAASKHIGTCHYQMKRYLNKPNALYKNTWKLYDTKKD